MVQLTAFWALTGFLIGSLLAPASGGAFARPKLVVPSSVSGMHDMALEVANNLTRVTRELKESKADVYNLMMDLGVLQTTVEILMKNIDDLKRQNRNDLNLGTKGLEDVRAKVARSMAAIQELKLAESNNVNLAPAQSIEAILSDDIDRAVRWFGLIENDKKIDYIVDQVYNNNNGAKFSLVVSFADSLQDKSKAYKVYKLLSEQMERQGHDDISRLMVLPQKIETNEINTINSIKTKINKRAVRDIISSIDSTSYMPEIANKIYSWDPVTYKDIIRKVVDTSSAGLAKLMETQHKLSGKQAYPAFEAIFDRLKSRQSDMDTYVLQFARIVKSYIDMKQTEFETLKAKLPSAIMTIIFFPSSVCFYNDNYGGYLREGESSFSTGRKNVFTSVSTSRNPATQSFKLEHSSDSNYYIKRSSKYLYADSQNQFCGLRRRVFLNENGCPYSDCSMALWTIEPSGRNVYLKSVHFGEYLTASSDNYKENSQDRRTFTWQNKQKVPAAVWQAMPCT